MNRDKELAAFEAWLLKHDARPFNPGAYVDQGDKWKAWCARANVEADRAQRQAGQEPMIVKGLDVDKIDPSMAFESLTRNTNFDGDLLMQAWEALKRRATAPPAAQVPEGYKLAPLEPTSAMLDALHRKGAGECDAYRAMLDVAPQPAAQPAVDAALRLAVKRTRDDLGATGDNYPAVRKLLAFAEAAIEAAHGAQPDNNGAAQ